MEKIFSRRLFLPFLFFAGMTIFLACNYYKPVQKSVGSPETAVKVVDSLRDKIFIIHTSFGDYQLENMRVYPDKEVITGKLQVVPAIHRSYIDAKTKKYKYSTKAPFVLGEVHLYASLDSTAYVGDDITIPARNITKLEVIERNKGKSTGNTILAVMGITIGTMAVITAISAALKGSCPFISAYDGTEYVLQGETFGGAIYPALAREDYVPLPAAAIGSEVKVCVSNELKERQYTDYANLLLVEHAPGERPISATNGHLFLVKEQYTPNRAVLNQNRDMLKMVSATDNLPCAFNDSSAGTSVNRLEIRFDKPAGITTAAGLVLDMRNSYWMEYVVGAFFSRFGSSYNDWTAQQKLKPGSEIIQWQESQHMPLTISVKTANGWREVQKVKTIGPLMNREVMVPIDGLDPESPVIEVAFSTGFMFWEMDCISLAGLQPVPASAVQYLGPATARDENGKNVLEPLSKEGVYLEQPEIGNRAYLTYKVGNYSSKKTYSAFLHSKGYYEPIRQFEGPADIGFLSKLKQPGAFTDFSLDQYRQVYRSAYLATSK